MIQVTVQRRAFLDTIALSEGTSKIGDDGYNCIVGGGTFNNSYQDHPRQKVELLIKGRQVFSTAAGRYQILARYFDIYKRILDLKDFTPYSQNQIALRQITECDAMADIDAGRFSEAVFKCKGIWASFPGAGYGQHEQTLNTLRTAFVKAGGKLTPNQENLS